MMKDVQGQIDTIKYDYRGLPLEIKKAGTSTYYRYNAEGQRVFKQTGTGVSTYYIMDVSGRTLAVVRSSTGYPVFNLWGNDHIGQLQVGYDVNGSIVVQGLETPLVVQPRSDTRYYFLKDHLGSVRVTVDVSGNVTSYDDFYPFGMTMDGRSGNFGSGDARYKYTTKERDAESGYDYFGARYYDARIGRWDQVEPLVEKYGSWSTYQYSLDNPIRFLDKDGRDTLAVVLPKNRQETGTALHIVNGRLIRAFSIIGRGKSRDVKESDGDTPTGEANVKVVDLDPNGEYVNEDGTPVTRSDEVIPDDLAAYGRFFVRFTDLSGDLLTSGRVGIGLHGGGTPLGDDALDADQDLVGTRGCTRVSNRNAARVVSGITDAQKNNRAFRIIVTEVQFPTNVERMDPLPIRFR
jgi:RHS repeat-associated protein